MENKHSTKVVRLMRRAHPATRIVAPEKRSKVPELFVDLARARHIESNDTSRVMLTSSGSTTTAHKGDHALAETFYKKSNNPEYGFAFASGVIPKLASLFLIPMILIYPLYPAYAADESVTQSATSTDATTLPSTSEGGHSGGVAASDKSQAAAEIPVTPPVSSTDASSTTGVSSNALGAVLGDATTSQGTASDTPPVVVTPEGGGSASDDNASSTATTTLQNDASSTDMSTASSSVNVGTANADSSALATTTEEAAPENVHTPSAEELAQEIIKQKEDSMRASIRKEVEGEYSKGCLTIDNIGYYCLKDPKGQSGSLTPSEVVTGVNSQLGEGSAYKQIFMTKGGASTQLTHDLWDDTFPSIDVSGKSIVWQGNVNGRWQIFFANAATSSTPAITALTHSNESNFNPRVDGDDVVWQGWVDGNWEIFLAEHLAPANYLSDNNIPVENTRLGIDHSWKVTRITTNSVHDMFPSVSGGLVTWQSFQDNTWAVYAYSIKTGATTKLSSDGAKSENPRFAITWDERTPEGAAHMVGYDIASGKTIDLTSEARQVSDDTKPYQPQAPISQDNQAALPPPAIATATSTSMKSGGDDDGVGTTTTNGLDI